MSAGPKLAIRAGTEDDWPLVFATILHGLYEEDEPTSRRFTGDGELELLPPRMGSPVSSRVDKSVFMAGYHEIVEDLLRMSRLRVAESTETPARPLLGYLLWRPYAAGGLKTVLHFAHVKRDFRRHGVFRALLSWRDSLPIPLAPLSPNDCEASHYRYDSDWVWKKWPRLVYNPFRAWPREQSNGTAKSTHAEHEAAVGGASKRVAANS